MQFFVVLLIALGWAGWLWAWGRNQLIERNGLGLPPSPLGPPTTSRFGVPQNPTDARQRRRQVLAGLALGLITSVVLARAWAPLWALAVGCAFLLGWFAVAVYQVESGSPERPIGQSLAERFGPVVDDEVPSRSPTPEPVSGTGSKVDLETVFERSA